MSLVAARQDIQNQRLSPYRVLLNPGRHIDFSGSGEALNTLCNVDAVPNYIAALNDNVALMDTDTKLDAV
jgi:hypothetical protein